MVGANLSVEILKAQRQIQSTIRSNRKICSHSSELPIWPHQKLEQKVFLPRVTKSHETVSCKDLLYQRKKGAQLELPPGEKGMHLAFPHYNSEHATKSNKGSGRNVLSPRWSPSRPNSRGKMANSVDQLNYRSQATNDLLLSHNRHPAFKFEVKCPTDPLAAFKLVDPNLPLWWNIEGGSDKQYIADLRLSLEFPKKRHGHDAGTRAGIQDFNDSVRNEIHPPRQAANLEFDTDSNNLLLVQPSKDQRGLDRADASSGCSSTTRERSTGSQAFMLVHDRVHHNLKSPFTGPFVSLPEDKHVSHRKVARPPPWAVDN